MRTVETDPVAVSALARRLSLPVRVQTLVQAESLFNDGTSLVLYQIAVSLAVGGTAGMAATGVLLHGVGEFVVLAGGGVLVGAVVGAGVVVVRRRITTRRRLERSLDLKVTRLADRQR